MLPLIPLLAASALAADGPYPFEVHTTHLDNGLTVHVVPLGTPDVAAVYTWFAVGSRDEMDEGRTGFAHFFEHLAFYGTESLPLQPREQKLLTLGVEENAWTWYDETVYTGVLPSEHVDTYLEMEADRFAHLSLTPADIQKEAGAVYGEYRKNAADPGEALTVAVMDAAFTEHTYGHDTIGYEADIARMPDAFEYSQTFFGRFYRPEHATLLVTGDVDPEAVFATVREHWAAWEPASEPRPELPVEPEQTELREVTVEWATPTAPRLTMAWKIGATDTDDPDIVALEAASDLLFASVGPLRQRLIREEAVAYSVWGGRRDAVDPTLFTIEVTCKKPDDLPKAERVIREEIAKLADGIDPEVLDQTRTHERYAWLTGLEDPPSVASDLGWFLRRHGEPEAIDRWWTAYEALTPEQIAEVVGRTFVDERLTIGRLQHVEGDAPTDEAPADPPPAEEGAE